MTVNELAERASTSTATVVRTARRLGFDGYPQLRLALAAHGAGQNSPTAPLGADIADGDDAAMVLAKLASFESEQLRATAELVDPAALDKVVRLIGSARSDRRLRHRRLRPGRQDLTAKLGRLGLNARAYTEHDAAMVSACLLGPADLAVGVSHSGENPGTVAPLRWPDHRCRHGGHHRRRPVPLAGGAEHVLVTAGREFGFRSAAMASRTGQLLSSTACSSVSRRPCPAPSAALHRTYAAVVPGSRMTTNDHRVTTEKDNEMTLATLGTEAANDPDHRPGHHVRVRTAHR